MGNLNIVNFSGIAGLVFLLFGIAGGFVVGFQQPLMMTHMAIGAVLLIVWLFISGFKNLGEAPVVLTGRNARFGVNVALYSAIFIGILSCINWAAHRYNQRWDFTEEGVYSLSTQSINLVSSLQKPLKLVAFIGNAQGTKERSLLELYKHHSNQVDLSFVDPSSKPHLIEKYGVSGTNRLYIGYGPEDSLAGESRIDEINEEAVTNAIIKLTRGDAKKIYYVVGHDEPSIEGEDALGLKFVAQAVRDEHFTLEKIFLADKKEIPSDAAVVMLVSPKKSLLAEEKQMLINYADGGGRLLMFHDPSYPAVNNDVREIADHFGIEVGNNLVIDQVQRLFAAPALGAQPIARSYGSHPVTRAMSQEDVTIYNMASTVKAKAGGAANGASITELVRTGNSAWGESDLAGIFSSDNPTATFDPSSDASGPVSVAVAYEKSISEQSESEQGAADGTGAKFEKAARVVVFGDSDWILNVNLRVYANKDLVLNALNWLAGEEGGVSIRPKAMKASAAPIEENKFLLILALSFLIPELLLIGGLFVWWQRRTVLA